MDEIGQANSEMTRGRTFDLKPSEVEHKSQHELLEMVLVPRQAKLAHCLLAELLENEDASSKA